MRFAAILLFLLGGCASAEFNGAKPDHQPLTAIVDGGVHSRCTVTNVRIANGVVFLEC